MAIKTCSKTTAHAMVSTPSPFVYHIRLAKLAPRSDGAKVSGGPCQRKRFIPELCALLHAVIDDFPGATQPCLRYLSLSPSFPLPL